MQWIAVPSDKRNSEKWSSEDKFLVANTLYKLKETEAPSGYDEDKNPHYFVIYQMLRSTQTV